MEHVKLLFVKKNHHPKTKTAFCQPFTVRSFLFSFWASVGMRKKVQKSLSGRLELSSGGLK
jgi:hypothetical protein